jgi:hypothetical protein
VDLDAPVGQLPTTRRDAHKLPSIVGGVRDNARDYLVAPSYLILDNQPAWREGGLISRDPPLVTLAIGFLAGNQYIMVDEVGGQHLVHGVQVSLGLRFHEAAYKGLVLLLNLRHKSVLLW